MTNRPSDSDDDAVPVWVRVCLDAVAYALLVTLATTVGAVVLGVLTGGGLLRVKYLLFVVGLLQMGYATFRLWPTSPEDLESGDSIGPPGTDAESRFERLVRTVPPVGWVGTPPPARRLSQPSKLFLTSVVVLLVSYLMETAFGVA